MKLFIKTIGRGLLIVVLAVSLSACSKVSSNKEAAQPDQQSRTTEQSSANQSRDRGSPSSEARTWQVSKADQLEKEEQVLVYLEKTVPEVKDFARNIDSYNKDSNSQCQLVMRIDAIPDPQAADALTRDFYYIYVGSDMGTHTSRWNSFYVKKDFSTVLVENLTGGSPLTVEQWRQLAGEPPAD